MYPHQDPFSRHSSFLAALVFRLFFIQMVSGPNLSTQAQAIRTITKEIPASRGLIYDRNGHILVATKPYIALYAYPDQITNKQAAIDKLAPCLKETPATILAILDKKQVFCLTGVVKTFGEACQVVNDHVISSKLPATNPHRVIRPQNA